MGIKGCFRVLRILGMAAVVALGAGVGAGVDGQRAAARDVFPGAEWMRVAEPRDVGADAARIEELRALLERGQTTGMMVVVGGRVVFEFGNTSEVSYVASVR